MQKRFNWRFAMYMTASLAVLGLGTYFLHAYQIRRSATAMLEMAHGAQEEGDNTKAAELLSRYLGLEPTDINVLAEYARLVSDDEHIKSPQARLQALQTLEKVLYREPQRHDLRRRAVQISMSLNDYASAREDLKTRLLPAFADDAELERLLGTCYEATGNYKEARTYYERSIQHGPRDTEAYTLLAVLLRRHTQDVFRDAETTADVLREADERINAMVQANAGSYRAYLLHASYLRTFKDPKLTLQAVANDVANAQKLSPDAVDCLLMAAEVKRDQGILDEARSLLRHSCDLHPKEWRFYAALARLEVRDNEVDLALDCLRQGLQHQPDQIDLLWDLADLLTAAKRKDEAETTINQLVKARFPTARLDYLNARLLMQAERWREAIKTLETAYSALVTQANQMKDDSAAQLSERAGLLLGQCYEQIGDASQAFGAYGRVVARNGQSIPGRLGLAGARWAQGRLKDALEQYRQLMQLTGAPASGWIEVARLELLINVNKDETMRRWSLFDQALTQAETVSPVPPAVALLRAEYHAARQQFDEARNELLNKYAEPKSRPVEVWTTLAALEARQGHNEAALALLDETQRQCGDMVELRLARARHWVRYGGAKASASLVTLAEGLDRFTAADRRHLLAGLGTACQQAGLTAEAKELWQRVAQELPDDLRSRIVLFDLATLANDDAAMKRWLQEIRGIEGADGVLWRYARIATLIGQANRGDKSGLKEAKSLLAAITPRRSDWSRIPLSAARIADLEQQYDAALPSYLRAIDMGERDPFAIGRAIVLLSSRGRDAEANKIARLMRDQTQLSHETQWVAAEAALRTRDAEHAIKLAEGAAGADSKDFRDHLLLGRVYWATKQFDRAELELLRARDLAPTAPATWETLVQFLVAAGKKDQARAEVEAAQRQLTGKSALLALARCHEWIGQIDQARQLYQEALKSAGADAEILSGVAVFHIRTGQLKEAQELLLRLSQNSDRRSATWARRLWAILLAAQGDPAKFKDALAQLDSLDSELSTTADPDEKVKSQRTRAQVLAMQKFRGPRQEAAQILDGLIERRMATSEDYALAAQLHEALGDWPMARRHYLGLLTRPDSDAPATLALIARSLLRHGEADVAEQALGRLEDQVPQAFVTKELRARLLHLQNQTGKAVTLLQECARTGSTDLRTAGVVLEELGQFREAEEMYRSFVAQSRRPEDGLLLVHYLIRCKRPADALDLCDRSWTTCPPEAVAEACLRALADMPSDPRQIGRVATRIEAALAQAPDKANLLVAQANLCNFQNRFSDAEELFRRALAQNARHATALNNLAWLLALKGGNGAEALALVNRAIDVAGADSSLLDTRAVAYLSLGKSDAAELALKDLEIVAAETPTAATFFHIAQAHELAGRHKEARQAWENASKKEPRLDSLHPLERATYQRLAEKLK